ncbi:MAG: type I CRISPR-associated protein Cas7 [Bacteroidales bacterium]|nr:type I CRISPR-associated protein Cas7 [Bacteroidales bacterium]
MTEFKNRVFGCAVVKAVNANYNADFSGQPRTLPSGTVYATDKAFKYTVKNYIKDVYDKEKVFYFKSLNDKLNPLSLDETYKKYFKAYPTENDKIKQEVAKNLLSCIDIRLFGATFAGETNISVHGPVQVNHGVNVWKENNIYSEQITSPFANKANDPDAEKGMTTIGRQAKLEEGHYLHHFSINPQNLCDITKMAGDGCQSLSDEDINKLKEAMRRGATWYDSASKAGCENEMLVWVQLKDDSKIVLPNFTNLIDLKDEKEEGKCIYDFSKLKEVLKGVEGEIASVEVFFNKQTCKLLNPPEVTKQNDL